MRYLFVGDTHGDMDLGKIRGPEIAALHLTERDAIIHCGDLGAPWRRDMDDILRFWQGLPYKVLICLGNHENYGWITRQRVVRRYGCRGYDLGGRLFAPLAGETAALGGRRFWFYPGGFSIDFQLRRPGIDLFEEELLANSHSAGVMAGYFRRRVPDYVISHDGPRSFIQQQLGFPIRMPPEAYYAHTGQAKDSRAHPAFALDSIYASRRYKRWYFGHHHQDIAAEGLRCLYRRMALEDSRTGECRLIAP